MEMKTSGKQQKQKADASRRLAERVGKPVAMWLAMFGLNPLALRHLLPGLRATLREYRSLRRQNRARHNPFRLRFNMPCPVDRYDTGGAARGHYFHQDLLVAQRIFQRNPARHVDVGSRVDGFVAHVASFREIELFDIRPLASAIPNICFQQLDIMASVPPELLECCDSLSCLHALEHFGLGRYGDPVDIEGHLKGFSNLTKLLKTGGTLYLSTPIGPERIDFNANRVFAVQTLLDLVEGHFEIVSFSYIDDYGDLHKDVPLEPEHVANNFGCQYGCAVFELRKELPH